MSDPSNWWGAAHDPDVKCVQVAPWSVLRAPVVPPVAKMVPSARTRFSWLPWTCSSVSTMVHAAVEMVPSRYLAAAEPPARPAVVVRQMPLVPLLSCAITAQVVALMGMT